MGASLYEILMGRFSSGIELHEIDEKNQTILSVMDNIQRILNSRAGATKHLPDYGLPDLGLIYQELPSSAYTLVEAIEKSLLKYEPRLQSINIRIRESSNDMVLNYQLVCHLKEVGLINFGTHFMPEGRVVLKRLLR